MEPIKVEVTLDVDSYLARYGAAINEDGDREAIPMTLEDVLIDQAAHGLLTRAVDSELKDSYRGLRDRVAEITAEEIRARIAPLVEEAISKPIRQTTTWGEEVGGVTTLREVILNTAKDYLNRPADNYNREKGTVVQTFIREEIAKAIKAELADTLKAAKAQVFTAVKDQAANLIAEAVRSSVPALR